MTEAQDSLDSRQLGPQAKRILKRTVTAATQKKEKQAEATLLLVQFFDNKYQYDSVINVATLALEKVATDSLKPYYYAFLARAYGRVGNIENGLKYANRASRLMRLAKDHNGEISTLSIKGAILFEAMRDDQAYQTYDTAITLMTLYNDSSYFIPVMGNLASCLLRLNDYLGAKEVLLKLKNSLPEDNNKLGLVYCNLGIAYSQLDNTNEAMQYYLMAIPKLKQLGSATFLGTVYFNLVGLYLDLNSGTEALKYAQLAEPLFEQAQPTRMGVIYTGYGDIYMLLKQYGEAEIYFKKALDFALQYDQWYEASKACELLKNLYQEQGNYKKALHYYEEFVAYNEKIGEQEKLEAIEKYLNSFELKQKEERIQNLEKINAVKYEQLLAEKKLRQLIIGLSIGLFFLLMLGTYLMYKFRIYRLKVENKTKLAELNNKLVLTRLSPHFIFNVLNSVQYYINANDKDKANNYLTKFADLMLNFLKSISKEVHPISKEIELLEEYAHLEQMLKNESFNFDIEIEADIDQNLLIPTMLLQPIVENAIQHGTTNSNPWVKVMISQTEQALLCIVEDNGPGIEGEINEEQSHGIKLCKDRIVELSTSLKKPFELIWTNKSGTETGLKVTLTIPK